MENEIQDDIRGQIAALHAVMLAHLQTMDRLSAARMAATLATEQQTEQSLDEENETPARSKEVRDSLIGAYLQMLSAMSR